MSLTIENDEASDLARKLAELTGESVSDAVTLALRERIDREREVQDRIEAMRAVRERIRPHLRPGPSAVEHGDILYDERGLPK